MPVKCKINTDSDVLDAFVNEEPTYVFEYYGTACQMASDVGGTPIRVFMTSKFYLESANYNNSKFIGFGVLNDNNKII